MAKKKRETITIKGGEDLTEAVREVEVECRIGPLASRKGKEMTDEEIISNFLRTAYTDEKLIELLDGAESGVLSFYSCCCLRGLPSAKHSIMGMNRAGVPLSLLRSPMNHGDPVVMSDAYLEADRAYYRLGEPIESDGIADDARRRERIIPLIKAEILRREQARSSSSQSVAVESVGV